MATAALIPVSEYLATTYRPDREYVDGVLKERNVGEQPHGSVQMILGEVFRNHRHDWSIRVLGDTRVQTSAEHYRIPDVCVLRSSDPRDPIINWAPLLCIEILSKDDTLRELQERVDDFLGLGVEHIWIIDPWNRLGWYASRRGFEHPVDGTFRIPGTPVEISLAAIFAELDE